MSRTAAKGSTIAAIPAIHAADLDPAQRIRCLAGRNRTKADIVVYRTERGTIAVKDFGDRPWWVRQTLGRLLIRREVAAYRTAAGLRADASKRDELEKIEAWLEER